MSVEPAGWILAERLEIPVVWTDGLGRVRLANRVARELFGWPATPGEAPSLIGEADSATIWSGCPAAVTVTARSGRAVAVMVTWTPAAPDGFYALLDPADPDWLTAAERARRIHWLLDLALDAALAVDARGRIREWNDRCTALFGYTPAEAHGVPFHELLHPEGTQGVTWNFFRQFLNESGRDPRHLFLQRKEVRLRDKSGRMLPVEIVPHALAAPDQVGENDIVMVTYCRDLTDHYARQRELEEALDRLRQSQQQMVQSEKMASLGLLTAGIAHEINNPVNFVAANVEPLRRDLGDILSVLKTYEEAAAGTRSLADARRFGQALDVDATVAEVGQLLEGLEDGARRTLEIVRGLRQFTRLDEDVMKPTRLVDGLESTLTLLRRQYDGRIAIVREYESVPEVECYPGQINQVFMNLLVNAIQAIDGAGRIRIRLRGGEQAVEVSIADSGRGIPAEIQPRIFEPFFTTKPVGQGTGLGLSISYGIVQAHQGTLAVTSAPGQGATFTLTLPVRQPPRR